MMLTFNAKVRLSGSTQNEVRKFGLTAPEVILLQRIHGEDAVLEIERAGDVVREDYDERQRLNAVYGESKDNRKTIQELFGAEFAPLPKTIPGVDLADLPKAGENKAKPRGSQRVTAKQAAAAGASIASMAA
jgi:hypothetical protein